MPLIVGGHVTGNDFMWTDSHPCVFIPATSAPSITPTSVPTMNQGVPTAVFIQEVVFDLAPDSYTDHLESAYNLGYGEAIAMIHNGDDDVLDFKLGCASLLQWEVGAGPLSHLLRRLQQLQFRETS